MTKILIRRDERSAQFKAAKLFKEVYPEEDHKAAPAYTNMKTRGGNTGLWIVDSGSCFDLIGVDDLDKKETAEIWEDESPVTLTTANGLTTAAKRVTLPLNNLKGDAIAVVLKNTPAVLSLGRKCMDEGYSFVWKTKEKPYLLTPDSKRIFLDVVNYVPMLAAPCVDTQGVTTRGATPAVNAEAQKAVTTTQLGDSGDAQLPVEHYITHFPKDSRCDVCCKCKIISKQHRRRTGDETSASSDLKIEKFGDLVTADHIIIGSEEEHSRHGDTCSAGQTHDVDWFLSCHFQRYE